MLSKVARLVAVALPVASVLAACDDDGTGPSNTKGTYLAPTTPANVVANLAEAYRHRELEPYVELLAPEFIFTFQTVDYDEVPTGFWTHDEDSVCTGALFHVEVVEAIQVELSGLQAQPSVEVDHPEGAVKVHILIAELQVDQGDGITWVVSDEQDMFFRRGLASAGEDTTHWFLFEWRDLEVGGFSSPADPRRNAPNGTTPVTWGSLKLRYCR